MRIKQAAKFFSIGILAGAAVSSVTLLVQGISAVRKIPNAADCVAFEIDGTYQPATGDVPDDSPLKLALMGDSISVGFGADHPDETPGVIISKGLASMLMKPVETRLFGLIGAMSSDLRAQVTTSIDWQPDVALIFIGSNDITHRRPLKESLRFLDDTVRRLTDNGAMVFVATCPDLSLARWILKPPLRWVAGWKSKVLARAQTKTIEAAGGIPVSLDDLRTKFVTDPGMFSPDMFHPSSSGYAHAAAHVLDAIAPFIQETG